MGTIAGWFVSCKIPSFEMDGDWGYPHGNPHVLTLESQLFLCAKTKGARARLLARSAISRTPADRLGSEGALQARQEE